LGKFNFGHIEAHVVPIVFSQMAHRIEKSVPSVNRRSY